MMSQEHDIAETGRQTSQIWLTAALLYFGAAVAVIHLTSNGRSIATIWPANAILVALLLADARPRWRTVLSAGFVANIAANLLLRGTLAGPILYGLANLIEVAVAVWLLRRAFGTDNPLRSTGAVLRFILIAGVLAPVTSGTLGSLTALLVFGEPLWTAFATWVASDGLGLLVFTPFLYAAFRGEFVTWFMGRAWPQRLEAIALLAMAGVVAWFIFFGTSRPLLFAIFPPLMLITFRVGRLGTEAAVMLVAVIGGAATMQGRGPVVLIAPDTATHVQAFQVVLATILMTCLPVAAEVTARADLTAALAAHDREMTASALTDPLTGILNRGGFESEARMLLSRTSSTPLSLLAVDFDHFKQINDRWGHHAGDLALRHVATLLRSHTRVQDIVGRSGGDEFMILLPNTALDVAREVGERIRAGVHVSPLSVDDKSVAFISLSIGAATSHPGERYEDLARRADRALYDAKERGRNTLCAST